MHPPPPRPPTYPGDESQSHSARTHAQTPVSRPRLKNLNLTRGRGSPAITPSHPAYCRFPTESQSHLPRTCPNPRRRTPSQKSQSHEGEGVPRNHTPQPLPPTAVSLPNPSPTRRAHAPNPRRITPVSTTQSQRNPRPQPQPAPVSAPSGPRLGPVWAPSRNLCGQFPRLKPPSSPQPGRRLRPSQLLRSLTSECTGQAVCP